MDSSDFLIDCLSEFKWVEGFKDFPEGFLGFFFDVFGFEESLVRRFGFVVAFDGFGTDPFFGHELHGRAEEVVEESPFLGIEIV